MKEYHIKYMEDGVEKETTLNATHHKDAKDRLAAQLPDSAIEILSSKELVKSPDDGASGSYSTGRKLAQAIRVVGWLMVGVGAIILLVALSENMVFIGSAITIAAAGLFKVALSEIMTAIFDMADNSRKTLEFMQKGA